MQQTLAGEMRAPIPVYSVAEQHSRVRISIEHQKL
jgi:hypothetical protein